MRPAARSRAKRKTDTLVLLRTEVDCWVASADETGNAHLVPLCYHWDGAALVLATPRSSPAATNLLLPASHAPASAPRAMSCSSTAV